MLLDCGSCAAEPITGPSATIGELIDGLPLGRLHGVLVCNQMLLNACFAIVLEMVPYTFQGLEQEFDLSGQEPLSMYSALFTGGAIFGAALSSLQDEFGRRTVFRFGAVCACFCASLTVVMPTWALVLTMRFPLGIAFAFAQ
eukprot:1844922-Prymnesium_polylepis.1